MELFFWFFPPLFLLELLCLFCYCFFSDPPAFGLFVAIRKILKFPELLIFPQT